jgi:hypothetical protein
MPHVSHPFNKRSDPAIFSYIRQDRDAVSLVDYHFICPIPRAVLPSRIIAWCREHCSHGWLMQMPRMGMPTWKNTVILFESETEMAAFRDHYCFNAKYHQRLNGDQWLDQLGDNV